MYGIMRIPLEILRLVFESAAADSRLQDVFALRLVNRLFRDEVTAAILRSYTLTDAFFRKNDGFRTFPPTLQREYLFDLVKKHKKKPSTFSSLLYKTLDLNYQGSKSENERVTQEATIREAISTLDLKLFTNHYSDNGQILLSTGRSLHYWLDYFNAQPLHHYSDLNTTIRIYLWFRLLKGRCHGFGHYVRMRTQLLDPVHPSHTSSFITDVLQIGTDQPRQPTSGPPIVIPCAAPTIASSRFQSHLTPEVLRPFLKLTASYERIYEFCSLADVWVGGDAYGMSSYNQVFQSLKEGAAQVMDMGDEEAFWVLMERMRVAGSVCGIHEIYWEVWGREFRVWDERGDYVQRLEGFDWEAVGRLREMGKRGIEGDEVGGEGSGVVGEGGEDEEKEEEDEDETSEEVVGDTESSEMEPSKRVFLFSMFNSGF